MLVDEVLLRSVLEVAPSQSGSSASASAPTWDAFPSQMRVCMAATSARAMAPTTTTQA